MRKYITVVSDKMTKQSENNIVRLSSSARAKLNVRDQKIELWTRPDSPSIILPVKPAYKTDISTVKAKGLRLRDVIFVSSNIARWYSADNNSTTWADTKPRKCAIGSDPEVMLFLDDRFSYAGDYVPFEGEIGSDGPMLELRPHPGANATDHVDNISKLILDMVDYVKEFVHEDEINLICTPFHSTEDRSYTSGGHIHLGISSFFDGDVDSIFGSEHIALTINSALNIGLAIPMQILDGSLGLKRREHYGYLGDIRTRVHRLEFRTLSSTWLLYKDLAETVLAVAHEIAIAVSDRAITLREAHPDYHNHNTYSLLTDIIEMECMQGDNPEITLNKLLTEDGCTIQDVNKYTIPVLDRLIDRKLIDKLVNIVEQCNPDKINRDLFHNWTFNKSIDVTFR